MKTITIQVNERTKQGRGLIDYLNSLGVIKESDPIIEAMQEVKLRKGTHCKTFEEYKRSIK